MNAFIMVVLAALLLGTPQETLIFKNGSKLEVTQLEFLETSVRYVYDGLKVTMPIQSVDVEATRKLMTEKEMLQRQQEEERLNREKQAKAQKEEKDQLTRVATPADARKIACSEQAREMLKKFQKRYQCARNPVTGPTQPPDPSSSQAPPRRFSVPFFRDGGVMLVAVSINGNPPIPFILDTGASVTTVSKEFAHRNGVRIDFSSGDTVQTAAGDSTVYPGMVSSLGVGKLTLKDFPVVVSPACRFNLLGSDFLAFFDYAIDNQRQVIYLIPHYANDSE